MLGSSWKNVECWHNVNISIKLSSLVHCSRERFNSNNFRTTDRSSSLWTLVNKLTTSKYLLLWMETLWIDSSVLNSSFLWVGYLYQKSSKLYSSIKLANFFEYYNMSIITVVLPLSAGCIVTLVSLHRVLRVNVSCNVQFRQLGLIACLTFHLTSFDWLLGISKITSLTGAIITKYWACLMVLVKLRHLFTTDSSKALLIIITYIDNCLYCFMVGIVTTLTLFFHLF